MAARTTRRAVIAGAGSIAALVAGSAEALAQADPIFAQIELHKTLLHCANTTPGEDDDPAFLTAVQREEAAIQALGDMIPATVAGAAAQLTYMAKIEGCFANNGSPLLKTVLSVARGLDRLGQRA